MSDFLTRDPLDVSALLASVSSEGCGATTVFVGTVRKSAEDGDVAGIEYSAYEEMAEAEFGRILADALAQWPEARIAVRHRIGYVPTGQASLVIAVASPHRLTAFHACRFVIEETKERAPVWKKEHLASGVARWVERSRG